jgi:hypothetical protein
MASMATFSLWMVLEPPVRAVTFGSCSFWMLILSMIDLLAPGVSLLDDGASVAFPYVQPGNDYYIESTYQSDLSQFPKLHAYAT